MSTTTDLIEVLQGLQTDYIKDKEAVAKHNIDENAHQNILDKINALKESDVMWTRAQIRAIIKNDVEELQKTIVNRLSEIDEKLALMDDTIEANSQKLIELETKVNSINQQVETDTTTLSGLLQVIEDKYAPILAKMQDALQIAIDSNNDLLTEQYKRAIQSTLEQKKTEMLSTIEEYVNKE